jgi:hypothetical protein
VDYVIEKGDTSISKLAVKFGAKASQWPEFCKANPKLKTHPTYGCVYYVGNKVNIPDNWPLAQPAIPPPGPNAPPGPAPVGPGSAVPGPIAPAPAAAGMFGFDTKTILIGAGVVGLGVVAVYFLKKKSQAAAA